MVECGTVNRPKDMESAWRCIGIEPGNPLRDNIHCQIDAAKSYHGSEATEDFSGRYERTYDPATWKEWRIWRSLDGWLKRLNS